MRKQRVYFIAILMIILGFLQIILTYTLFPDHPTFASLIAVSGCLIIFEACINLTCVATHGRLSNQLTQFSNLLLLVGGAVLISWIVMRSVGNGDSFPQSGKLEKHHKQVIR